jgi:DNA-binding MurR/RpiR family transcriptional regulator
VSNSGWTRETIDLLALAHARGALTVAVTSATASPLTDVADVHIQTYHTPDGLTTAGMAAKYAQMVVFDALYVLVAEHDRAGVDAILRRQEEAVARHRPAQSGRRRR